MGYKHLARSRVGRHWSLENHAWKTQPPGNKSSCKHISSSCRETKCKQLILMQRSCFFFFFFHQMTFFLLLFSFNFHAVFKNAKCQMGAQSKGEQLHPVVRQRLPPKLCSSLCACWKSQACLLLFQTRRTSFWFEILKLKTSCQIMLFSSFRCFSWH